MSQKRRGLGRGLGALIPAAPTGTRPADVFFGDQDDVSRETSEESNSTASTDPYDAAPEGALPAAPGATVGAAAQSPSDITGGTGRPAASAGGTTVGGVAAGSETTGGDQLNRNGHADEAEIVDLVPVPGATFSEIRIDRIHANAQQPRSVFDEEELAELTGSIREIGVLQPIVVRPSRVEDDGYELIMGERRWRASEQAGLDRIPAIIRETDDADLLRDALLENLHRSALNPLEEAAAYQQLLDDFDCTQEELSQRISRSRPQISNTLRLLRLPALVQRRVAAGVLSAGHARALLRLEDAALMERLAQRIVAEGLSVRATEEIVALGGVQEHEKVTPSAPRAGRRVEAVDHLASRLSDRFETRVKVSLGKRKGKLTVEFATVDDLNRILGVMAPEDPGLLKGSKGSTPNSDSGEAPPPS